MEPPPDVELLASETLFRGPIFDVRRDRVRLPSGLVQDLSLVVHGGAVAIAAETDDGELLLVRQYRHAAGAWLLEVPAGRLEAGEEPLAAARRELEEEAGYRAAHWEVLLRFFPAPGFCSERMTLFHARGLRPAGAERLAHDADEELELVRMAPRAILEAGIPDAKTILAAALVRALG